MRTASQPSAVPPARRRGRGPWPGHVARRLAVAVGAGAVAVLAGDRGRHRRGHQASDQQGRGADRRRAGPGRGAGGERAHEDDGGRQHGDRLQPARGEVGEADRLGVAARHADRAGDEPHAEDAEVDGHAGRRPHPAGRGPQAEPERQHQLRPPGGEEERAVRRLLGQVLLRVGEVDDRGAEVGDAADPAQDVVGRDAAGPRRALGRAGHLGPLDRGPGRWAAGPRGPRGRRLGRLRFGRRHLRRRSPWRAATCVRLRCAPCRVEDVGHVGTPLVPPLLRRRSQATGSRHYLR